MIDKKSTSGTPLKSELTLAIESNSCGIGELQDKESKNSTFNPKAFINRTGKKIILN